MAISQLIPEIDAARCSGCGWCIAACPLHLFAFEKVGWRKISVLKNSASCTGCSKCDTRCPISAIAMRKIPKHDESIRLQAVTPCEGAETVAAIN